MKQRAMGSSGFAMNLPTLDGKNNECWSIQMKAILGYQDCLEIVQKGLGSLAENATDAQRNSHRDSRKKDCKALCLLHQCVDPDNFENISRAETSKAAWEILEKSYSGVAKVKKVKLQTLRRQFELLAMEDQESIAGYFNRIQALTNSMKNCGEEMKDQLIVEKVLCTLTARFDHVVVAMEESKDLESLKVEELQGSLEAHEQRLQERVNEKNSEQALQAHTKKGSGQYEKSKKGKGKWKGDKTKHQDGSKGDNGSSSEKGDSNSSQQKQWSKDGTGKKKKDKKHIQCWNCSEFGHFASECKSAKGKRRNDEARLAQEDESDEEQVR